MQLFLVADSRFNGNMDILWRRLEVMSWELH
jgi:hypothetical protein